MYRERTPTSLITSKILNITLNQHTREICPASLANNSRRFKGSTAILVSTPFNVSCRNRVVEYSASDRTAEYTQILFAGVAANNSDPLRHKQ